MKALVSALSDHLEVLVDRLECFSRYEVQVEAWFKGEMLAFLGRMKITGRIVGFEREVSVGRKKIDFAIDVASGRHWVELKHWLIGYQKGDKWRPVDYVDWLKPDVERLKAVQAGDRAWILVFCTANPGEEGWTAFLRKFDEKYSPLRLVPHSSPKDYPDSYFLGLLQLRGM